MNKYLTEVEQIRNMINIVSEASARPSARLQDPNITYQDQGKTKKATAAGEFDRVVAFLEKSKSAQFTKIGNTYREIADETKRLNKLKTDTNNEATKLIESLFPIADDVVTRVVDTKSLVLTLSKVTQARQEERLDIDGYVAELESLLGESAEKLAEIRSKFTKVVDIEAKKPRLMAPKLKNESLTEEGSWKEKFVRWANLFREHISSWLDNFDSRWGQLEARVQQDLEAQGIT